MVSPRPDAPAPVTRAVLARRLVAWLRGTPIHARVLALLFFALAICFFVMCRHLGQGREAPGDGSYARLVARGDGHYYFLGTRSLVCDGDFDLTNDYARFGDPFRAERTVTGRPYTRELGPSLLFVPGFLVAQGLAATAHLLGSHIALHGYTSFHQTVTYFIGTLAPGCLAIVLVFLAVRRRLGEGVALWAALAVALATPLFFYTCLWPSYTHAQAAFLVSALLYYTMWTEGRTDLRRMAVLGALAGLAALSRENEALFALYPGYDVARVLVAKLRTRDRLAVRGILLGGALFFAVFFAVLAPELWYNLRFAGGLFAIPQGPGFMRWSSPRIVELLASPHNGLLTWTPIALLGIAGLVLAPRSERRVAWALLACLLVQVYVDACVIDWHGSWGMGQRRLCDSVLPFGLGIGYAIARARDLVRARPRLLPRLALLAALLPFVVLNIDLAWALSHGTQTGGGGQDSKTLFVGQINRIIDGIYTSAGNPAQAPVAWPLALRHWVSPAQIDRLLIEPLLAVYDYRRIDLPGFSTSDTIRLGNPSDLATYGASGLAAPAADGANRYAWVAGRRARLLLNVATSRAQTWIMRAAPNLADGAAARSITVRIDGRVRGTLTFGPGFTLQRLDLPAGAVHAGFDDVVLEADAAPPLPAARKGGPLDAASLAIDSLTLSYTVR